MDTEIKKIIEERIKKLPPSVAKAIRGIPWLETIKNIAKNNNLSEDKEISLIIETTILVYGIESPKKYAEDLIVNLGVGDDLAEKILKEIETQILIPIQTLTGGVGPTEEQKNSLSISSAETRARETANKYSLTSSQTNTLVNNTLSSIRNGQKVSPEQLVTNLNISKLLAEQITLDLEKRVFEHAVKQVSPEKREVEKPKPETPSKIPEIRPDNLPMQGSNFIPTPKPAFQNETLDKQRVGNSSGIGVPRYATDNTPPIATSPAPSARNIIEKKLNDITVGNKPPETKYEKDPYREPLG
ncbi:MAG: hypothetical protein CEO12_276 [Parcubacteria group bacterium Gr01-1014_46]|nr:MAG: hypothetical protein CEO12_276 [Parcubacteria group bacterium Gr01-1014_46]